MRSASENVLTPAVYGLGLVAPCDLPNPSEYIAFRIRALLIMRAQAPLVVEGLTTQSMLSI